MSELKASCSIFEYHNFEEYKSIVENFDLLTLPQSDRPRNRACSFIEHLAGEVDDGWVYSVVCNRYNILYGMPALIGRDVEKGQLIVMNTSYYYNFFSPYGVVTYSSKDQRSAYLDSLNGFTLLDGREFDELFDESAREAMVLYSAKNGKARIYTACYECDGMKLPVIVDTSLEQGEIRYMRHAYYIKHFMKDRTYISFDGFRTNPDNWDGGLKLV